MKTPRVVLFKDLTLARAGAAMFTLLSACALVGCSTPMATPGQKQDGGTQLADAATSPLADLNLVKSSIPEVLRHARETPYAQPSACPDAQSQLVALNAVLGSDLDSPRAEGEPDWFGKAGATLGDAAVGGLRSATEGLLPFRSWIRKLTGAESHSNEVKAALAAGLARRAFIRGWSDAKGCPSLSPAPAPAASR